MCDRPAAARPRPGARRSPDVPLLPRLLGGPQFAGHPLTAADGQKSYIATVGDSVYYGDCVHSKGVFGVGTCQLPLQVTTVIYSLHSNASLGPQRNTVIRGVPATVYDEGRSIELYSGRVAIDIFSDTFAHALRAAGELLPLNAPGSASADLPPPVFCPGLSGPIGRTGQEGHEQPAPPRLPAGRRRPSPSPTACPERYPGTGGAIGFPISLRRLRNASEPITAGTHSEITR